MGNRYDVNDSCILLYIIVYYWYFFLSTMTSSIRMALMRVMMMTKMTVTYGDGDGHDTGNNMRRLRMQDEEEDAMDAHEIVRGRIRRNAAQNGSHAAPKNS